MQIPPLSPRWKCLLAGALILACPPWGVSVAQIEPQAERGLSFVAESQINPLNTQSTIDIELNRTWGLTPFEVEATVTVTDPEELPMQCVIRFEIDDTTTVTRRMPTLFPQGSPQVTVERFTYEDGSGVRRIRVACRDFDRLNRTVRAYAYVTLNPCDGYGFNACGTCGHPPKLRCRSDDLTCKEPADFACTPVCGDGSVSGSEACDGTIVLEETCTSLGLGRGRLSCSSDCQGFVASGCTEAPACPDSYAEPAPHTWIPDPPDRVGAAAEGCRKIRVAWKYDTTAQTTSSSVPGLSGFVVYRDGVPIAETTGRETCSRKNGERAFVDDAVESGAIHTYQIAALNNLGQASDRVGAATVTVPASNSRQCADTIPPPTPANLRRLDSATNCHDTRVAVDGVSDVGMGIRGYRYYLDGTERCIEVAADHVSGGLRLQYSRGLYPGASYDVQVSAVDDAGNESALTDPLSVEVAECERPTEYKTVVVLVTYPDMPPPPMTPPEVAESMFGSTDSLHAYYDENSQSTVAINPGPGGGVTEWLVLPNDRLYYCEVVQDSTEYGVGAYCDFDLLRRDVNELLGDSIDFDELDKTIYAFYGSGGANSAVNMPFGENGLHMSTLVHETAHAWASRQHAGGLTCPPGHQVPPDVDDPILGCTLSEYGDASDPMGSGSGHFSAHNKIEMGLLGSDRLSFARQNAYYTVAQLALPSSGRKEVRIPLGDHEDKDPAYSFEYRRPDGWDAGIGVDGVIVRIVGPDLQRMLRTSDDAGRSEPIVLNPEGEPFVDPYRDIQVRVHAKDPGRAVLQVCRD